MADTDARVNVDDLSDELNGLVIAEVNQPTHDTIALRFTSGAVLTFRTRGSGVDALLTRPRRGGRATGGMEPTRRQREYLEFIKRYMHRFGVAPAESDIQRHFLVSAPSVNQMVRTLERRGFIQRDRDWFGQAAARSIRVVWEE